jgi:AcrR family transcriptional regulator
MHPSRIERGADVANADDTRTRILLTAEQTFARDGYSGASMRSIMVAAAANAASIHYYFRSKEGLLKAIFELRAASMNEERNILFDQCETKNAAVDAILRAFFGPAIARARSIEGHAFEKLSALCSVDPNPAVRQVVFDTFDSVGRRFVKLLRKKCSHLANDEFYWRLNCAFGSMMYVRTNNGRVTALLGPTGADAPVSVVTDQLVAFTAAGLMAPSKKAKKRK